MSETGHEGRPKWLVEFDERVAAYMENARESPVRPSKPPGNTTTLPKGTSSRVEAFQRAWDEVASGYQHHSGTKSVEGWQKSFARVAANALGNAGNRVTNRQVLRVINVMKKYKTGPVHDAVVELLGDNTVKTADQRFQYLEYRAKCASEKP